MKKMLKVNMLRLLLGMSTLVFLGISGSFTAYADDTPAAPQQHKRVVKGRVTDKKTGEPIVGATVWFKESNSNGCCRKLFAQPPSGKCNPFGVFYRI